MLVDVGQSTASLFQTCVPSSWQILRNISGRRESGREAAERGEMHKSPTRDSIVCDKGAGSTRRAHGALPEGGRAGGDTGAS